MRHRIFQGCIRHLYLILCVFLHPSYVYTSDNAQTPVRSIPYPDTAGKSGCSLSIPGLRVIRPLDGGGLAQVYLVAKAGRTDHPQMALKILRNQFWGLERMSARFRYEFDVLKRFSSPTTSHPHVIQVFEYGTVEGRPFFTMQWVRGENLCDKTTRKNFLTPMEVAHIFLQVADTLHAMREKGLAAHGDIKPANIVVTLDGRVKLIDFGLARLAGDSRWFDLYDREASYGTPYFMAPEMLSSEELIPTQKTDLFAMGVSMFWVLTGIYPFDGYNPRAVFYSILEDSVPNLRNYQEVPEPLARIVYKLLQKDPDHRYPSAQEVSRDLKIAIEEMRQIWE